MGAHPNLYGRKTTYWILSPPSSSTCQWGYPFFSVQPYFHCPAVWSTDLVQLQSTVYYIPSSTLTLFLQNISPRDFCTLINCLLAPFKKYTHSMCYYVICYTTAKLFQLKKLC